LKITNASPTSSYPQNSPPEKEALWGAYLVTAITPKHGDLFVELAEKSSELGLQNRNLLQKLADATVLDGIRTRTKKMELYLKAQAKSADAKIRALVDKIRRKFGYLPLRDQEVNSPTVQAPERCSAGFEPRE
jgi:hypothetical protein